MTFLVEKNLTKKIVSLHCIVCKYRRKFPSKYKTYHRSIICDRYEKNTIIAGHDGYGRIFKVDKQFCISVPEENTTAD
jgi:hypothetical protein